MAAKTKNRKRVRARTMVVPIKTQVDITSQILDPDRRVEHGLQIAVLDRGFVFVGDVATDGRWCYVSNASCVRRWGTTNGLGELAQGGPLENTKLDPSPPVRVTLKALLFLIACNVDRWPKTSAQAAPAKA